MVPPKKKLSGNQKETFANHLNSESLNKLLDEGLAKHQEGHLNEALEIYERILKEDPHHFDALQLSGTIFAQNKNMEGAVRLLSKALEIFSGNAFTHFNLALALQEMKRIDDAIASYDIAIQLNPSLAQAYSNRGLAWYEKKQFNQAITDYNLSLKLSKNQAEVYFNRALALDETDRPYEAIADYDRAINLNPKFAEAYFNRGNTLHALGKFDASISDYKEAISLNPLYTDAYLNLGNAQKDQGQLDEAINSYEKVININPGYTEAHCNLGNVQKEKGLLDEAISSYEKAINLNQSYAPTYLNLGNLRNEQGLFNEALKNYEKAINLNPNYSEAYSSKGIALEGLMQLNEAIINHEKAVKIAPFSPTAHYNLGNALKKLNHLELALNSYDKAVELRPNFVDAYTNKGKTLQDLKQTYAAIKCYRKAIELNPQSAEAFNNLGTAQKELNQINAAIKSYKKAISIDPKYAAPYSNLGVALQDINQLDLALINYDQAINLKNDFAPAYWNKSILKLLLGDFLEGWELYEWRWKCEQEHALRIFPEPFWDGRESIKDKTILIHAEQGYGDTIQFCRYIELLEALSPKEILVELPKALLSIFTSLKSKCKLIEHGKRIPQFDFHCPMMSLPYAFKTTIETIPATIPYLYADGSKTRFWSQKLGIKKVPRIGLAWSGSEYHSNDHNRSIKLQQFESLFTLPIEFHCLQKEIRPADMKSIKRYKKILFQHHESLKDFSDTAGLIENLDVVITVDTSVAHLAGSMGKEVFILLPFAPDFRWMLKQNNSIWYSTAVLLRQKTIGDWDGVIDQLLSIIRQKYSPKAL